MGQKSKLAFVTVAKQKVFRIKSFANVLNVWIYFFYWDLSITCSRMDNDVLVYFSCQVKESTEVVESQLSLICFKFVIV